MSNCSGLVYEDYIDENLRKWFKDKWVRFDPMGKIRGDCARGFSKEGKIKCPLQEAKHTQVKKDVIRPVENVEKIPMQTEVAKQNVKTKKEGTFHEKWSPKI